MDGGDSPLVGLVLLGITPFLVIDALAYRRGGFDSAFWRLPVENQLQRISRREREWMRIGLVWMWLLVILTAGLGGFAFLLGGAGEIALAGVGLGAFLVGETALLVALALSIPSSPVAARIAQETGSVPAWLEPLGRGAYWMELVLVVATNLGYVAWGIGMVRSGFPAAWAGWASIAVGGGIVIVVVAVRAAFQHLIVIVPMIIAIALLVS